MVGLSTVGLLLLGPTATMVIVIVTDLDRRKYVVWTSLAPFVMYAGLTAQWSLIL